MSTDFSAVSGTLLSACFPRKGRDKVLVTLRCDLVPKAAVFVLPQFPVEYCNEVPGNKPALTTTIHKIFMFVIRHCHAVGWVTTMSKPASRLAHCLPRAEEVLS